MKKNTGNCSRVSAFIGHYISVEGDGMDIGCQNVMYYNCTHSIILRTFPAMSMVKK